MVAGCCYTRASYWWSPYQNAASACQQENGEGPSSPPSSTPSFSSHLSWKVLASERASALQRTNPARVARRSSLSSAEVRGGPGPDILPWVVRVGISLREGKDSQCAEATLPPLPPLPDSARAWHAWLELKAEPEVSRRTTRPAPGSARPNEPNRLDRGVFSSRIVRTHRQVPGAFVRRNTSTPFPQKHQYTCLKRTAPGGPGRRASSSFFFWGGDPARGVGGGERVGWTANG
jgi:hypothetical protein